MSKIKFLSKENVQSCLSMNKTIEAMKLAFSELSKKNVELPLRINMNLADRDSGALFMPVFLSSCNQVGLKSVMIHKKNPSKNLPMIQAMYQVFNAETGEPLAIMDGEYLTAMRTGAASGLATDLLSPKDSEIAAIFGAGTQSEKQLDAICSVRDIKKVFISDLNQERVKKFIINMQASVNAEIIDLAKEENLKEADIICTATSSSEPVFKSSNLKEKVHINGIGSYTPDMCEIPHGTIVNAKLYVDSREACLSEAGDIIQPIKKNLINSDHIFAELGEVVINSRLARSEDDRITIFKSVGNAVQDIVTASLILENAEKLNLGTEIVL